MIAPESRQVILYLRKPTFFHGDIIRDIGQKERRPGEFVLQLTHE